MAITFKPIGVFKSTYREKYQLPKQSGMHLGETGIIKLNPQLHFEIALQDLIGFERIWVIFYFHRAAHWKPKVMPPRGGIKRGVFATRSPHRPNPIGMSNVRLIAIDGLDVTVDDHDLLDE